jgi:molecular chaperone IbpA
MNTAIDMLNKMSIGFEDFWLPEPKQIPYPPYNIIRESEDTFNIEMAVAGFGKEDIEIYEEDGKLVITGNILGSTDNHKQIYHRGLAKRKFKRTFNLAPNITVLESILQKGILYIKLVRETKNRNIIQIQ